MNAHRYTASSFEYRPSSETSIGHSAGGGAPRAVNAARGQATPFLDLAISGMPIEDSV